MMTRIVVLIGMVCLLALAGCDGDDGAAIEGTPAMEATPDVDYAMRWWNVLTPDQMVAALHGDMATEDQDAAARKLYADLDDATKALVNAAAAEIYDPDADYASVGDWWETLDCRLMRVAAGDGITADPMSPYCAHYPGSGAAKILSEEAKAHVDYVGMALLDLDEPGLFAPDNARAMRWWNVLNAEEMVAALYGDEATEEQTAAAQRLYADLDDATKALVNVTADELYGMGDFDSIGEWWETLDCRLMRVAAGDGNVADPESPYCAHYPGSGEMKILSRAATEHVNMIGAALLGYEEMMAYAPADMMAFDDLVEGMTAIFSFEGGSVFKVAFTGPGRFYSFDDPDTPGEFPGEFTWEYLDDGTDAGRLTIWWDLNDPDAYLWEAEMMFLEMDKGLVWSAYSESGEVLRSGTGTFEITETME